MNDFIIYLIGLVPAYLFFIVVMKYLIDDPKNSRKGDQRDNAALVIIASIIWPATVFFVLPFVVGNLVWRLTNKLLGYK